MTTKQRAYLRGIGTTLTPILHIGKEGITDAVCKQCWDALEAHELIKVQIMRGAPYTAREACDILCDRVHAQPVQVIGNRCVIYREARTDPKFHLDEIV